MHKFIVFEGIDGAGKGTQIDLLAKRLRKSGKRFSLTHSPNYASKTGDLAKRALYGEFGDFVGLDPHLAAPIFLLDFVARRETMVRDLKKGMIVADRYLPSTIAYLCARLVPKQRKAFQALLEDIMYRVLRMPNPDLILYFDVPVAQAQKNLDIKQKDQYEADTNYQKRVAEVYKELAKQKGWKVIPCTKNGNMRSPQEIHESVWKAVQ